MYGEAEDDFYNNIASWEMKSNHYVKYLMKKCLINYVYIMGVLTQMENYVINNDL